MSTAQIAALIDGPVATHDPWAWANYMQQLHGIDVPATVGDVPEYRQPIRTLFGSDDFGRSAVEHHPTVDQQVDGQVLGHSGPSLDSYPTVDYRADTPGFGGFNDQPMFSGDTNFAPGVDPSAEVGTGKPPGWVVAHMPLAQGVNPTRSSYAYQGVFADGEDYFPRGGDGAQAREFADSMRAPWWPATLDQPGQNPNSRAMWPGSAIIEQAPGLSLSQILGRVTDGIRPGWGVQ